MARRAQSNEEKIDALFGAAQEVDARMMLFQAGYIVRQRFGVAATNAAAAATNAAAKRTRGPGRKLNGAQKEAAGVGLASTV